MADSEGSETQRTDLVVREPTESPKAGLDAIDKLVNLERQRIESINRRTELAGKAIEASDAADQRQYDYHVARMQQSGRERAERRRAVACPSLVPTTSAGNARQVGARTESFRVSFQFRVVSPSPQAG